MTRHSLQQLLDSKVDQYNRVDFIESDPIVIPHQFTSKQDIEISGFFAAIFAWGLRKTIINKSKELMKRMDNSPYDFIINHTEQDLKQLLGFKHRTFNDTDLLFFVEFFHRYYKGCDSLENLFTTESKDSLEKGLIQFYNRVFTGLFPQHTKKHLSTPAKNSTCKRLNMYLRWMVRKDDRGVDFGIWTRLKPSQLLCPLDVHAERVARQLGLIDRKQVDWKTVLELTQSLRELDPNDPVKYDFALFGIGVFEP